MAHPKLIMALLLKGQGGFMTTISASAHLDLILDSQKKKAVPDWIGDAIYGVNDGLGAIFGIIAGVAGYTANSHTILISGMFGALASTLSMAAGAWLATKSENELMERGMGQAREDVRLYPERELHTLSLLYQTKGFEEQDADRIAKTIASDEENFINTMAQEKYGLHESHKGKPGSAALFGGVSTLIGGIVPLIPFFIVHGTAALVFAAIVSVAAHFAVGALKSIVTVRSWWASGLEMTLVGVLVGVISYALGIAGFALLK